MADPISSTTGVFPCVETNKHITAFKEGLLKPLPETSPCEVYGDLNKQQFKPAFEKDIVSGAKPATGEIPTAISEEQVQINNYYLKKEDQQNTGILLCGSMDTWEAYSNLSQCLAIPLAQEGSDLPKLIADLSKATAGSAKEFPVIADKIKKACEQVLLVQAAFNALEQCINKACAAEDKAKIVDALKMIGDPSKPTEGIRGAINGLIDQANQAAMSVVQAASIFALNNMTGLEAIITSLKPQAEAFKKSTDSQVDAAAKKTTEWQKKYNDATTALVVASTDFGKASSLKVGKESTFCTMNKSDKELEEQKLYLQSQKKALLDIFNPENKGVKPPSQVVTPEAKY